MALTDGTIADMKNCIESATPEQRQILAKYIASVTEQERAQRRKELWGNVVAAIEKYEREIEPINFLSPDDDPMVQVDMRGPGEITLQWT